MTPTHPDDRFLGEYRLKTLYAESPLTWTWIAEQVSVARQVLVDELRPDQLGQRDVFLADVRAKAAVDHPLIGSVFEAVAEPACCFYAHEWLPGATLHDRMVANAPIEPARLAQLLRDVAEAQLYHEAAGHPCDPLGLAQLHVDDHGVLRLDNLARAGTRQADESARDIQQLGRDLEPLVKPAHPGSTRMLTLLGWMRGVGLEAPIIWEQVRDLCEQIDQQLAEAPPAASPTHAVAKAKDFRKPAIMAAAVVLVLLSVAALSRLRQPTPDRDPASPGVPAPVLVPAGKYPTPDGTEEPVQAFRIAVHEVTIGEYAEFLETLETLAKDQRHRTFDHEAQPASKISHIPDDWDALLAAAKSQATYQGRSVTLNSPVIGVDWWDAAAYAEWQQARLPTQEEWFAALRRELKDPSQLVPSDWQPVTASTSDRSPHGLTGMAGSVREWTRRPAINPTNPLGERKWVLIGGSYLQPNSNALTREWVNDRDLRRPDIGFRIVLDAK